MPGDCHYLEGNTNARRRIDHLQRILVDIGLEPERLRMVNMSAAMAAQFVESAEQMTETIQRFGPNPLRMNAKDRGMQEGDR
jgi:F420-non-reducing hydrogenase iron-sulfur subunit